MIPQTNPVAWDVGCIFCRRVAGTTPMGELDSSWWSQEKRAAMRCQNRDCEEFGELAFDVYGRELGARWGEQWAAVAWLAQHEVRAGALFQWLAALRELSDAKGSDGAAWLRDQFDTAPEDAMQILAVNL